VEHVAHDRELRLAARQALKYPPVSFDEQQRAAIAEGYAKAAEEGGYLIHGCAVMPDHSHHVIGRHKRDIARITGHLKARASQALRAAGCHPLQAYEQTDGTIPTPWAEGCWKVFLDSDQDVRRAVRYVNQNPTRDGLPEQMWPFVTPYLID
jgi:REP element-mobilizing transposase RayT